MFCFVMRQKGFHCRGYLPHVDYAGMVQHIVLRTRKSLPVEFFSQAQNVPIGMRRHLADQALDASQTGRIFNESRCAEAFEDQLRFFKGQRYELLSWCVMPNHIHVVLVCLGHATIGQIVRTWKVQTTVRINAETGSSGPVFAVDYFDRYMRDGKQTEQAVAYVEANPVKAGLCVSPEDWRFSSAWRRKNGWEPNSRNLPLILSRMT
jgi:putative transposase